MSEDRYAKVRDKLRQWSKPVKTLRTEHSTGQSTARAVILLIELDKEIRETTKGELSLDNVTRGLMRMDKVSTQDFIAVTESVLRGPSTGAGYAVAALSRYEMKRPGLTGPFHFSCRFCPAAWPGRRRPCA